MFIQVVHGRIASADELRSAADRWMAELAPGATGWLGSTGGVTPDGRAINLARFTDAEAAAANSARPEQGAWWSETAKAWDGEPTFTEGTDVEIVAGGGSDDAGFVQFMCGTCTDPARLRALEEEMLPVLREVHAGLIGSVRLWQEGGGFIEANYFTDEAAARTGEAAMGERTDLAEQLATWQSLFGDLDFFDLPDPILLSP